jgi:hypothetical protein
VVSDIALFAIVLGLWTHHPLPASMTAVGVLLLETVWIAEFLALLVIGSSPVGLAEYMRDESIHRRQRAVTTGVILSARALEMLARRLQLAQIQQRGAHVPTDGDRRILAALGDAEELVTDPQSDRRLASDR